MTDELPPGKSLFKEAGGVSKSGIMVVWDNDAFPRWFGIGECCAADHAQVKKRFLFNGYRASIDSRAPFVSNFHTTPLSEWNIWPGRKTRR